MNVCMAQINTLVGDIAGNTQRVLEVSAAQKAAGAHVVVFPELTLTGYPPEDLLLRGDLLDRTEAALAMLCGVWRIPSATLGSRGCWLPPSGTHASGGSPPVMSLPLMR